MSLPRSSWRVMAVALVLAVSSLALADAPPQAQQVPVTITLNANNTVTVSPVRVEVRPGGQIDWSANAPFAVVVERHGSVFPGNRPPQSMRGRANAPLHAQVRGNATQGEYKYTVVVWDAGDGEMRVQDPEIVVLPPPNEED